MTRNGLTIEYEKQPEPQTQARPLWLDLLIFGLIVGIVVEVLYR